MLKKSLFMVFLLIVLSLSGAAWAQSEVKISVNGKFLTPDVPAQIINGSTVVPLRFVSEALGAQVGWDGATRTAIVRKNFVTDTPVTTPLKPVADGKLKLEINGQLLTDVPLLMVDGRVLVPIRIISETFGARVDWHQEAYVVAITYGDQAQQSAPLELLVKATQNLKALSAYSFWGYGDIDITLDMGFLSVNMPLAMDLDGSYRSPDEMYVSTYMSLPDFLGMFGGEQPEDISIEYYIKGDKFFKREGLSDQWEEEVFAGIPYNTPVQQLDPDFYLQAFQDSGLTLNYLDDYTEDGITYHVVSGELAGSEFLKFILNSDVMGLISAGEANELEKVLTNLSGIMVFYIDAESLLLAEAYYYLSLTMEINEDDFILPLTLETEVVIFYYPDSRPYFPEIEL